MADEAFDADEFVLHLPLWTIANKKICEEKGLTPAIATFITPEFGRFVPLFSDNDLAVRFMVLV